MKRLLVLLTILLLLIPTAIYASDVSNAEYLTTVTITNNGTPALTNAVGVFTFSTANMITGRMLSADATDCAMLSGGSDVHFMPAYGTNPWCVFIPSIGAWSQVNQYLYSKGATGGLIKYFPAPAGMTTPDDDTDLELADNFTIVLTDWWVNTDNGSGKYLVYKEDAFWVKVSETVSGNITACIRPAITQARVRLYGATYGLIYEFDFETTTPTGSSDASSNWTNDNNAWDDNTGTYAESDSGGWTDFLVFTHAEIICDYLRVWALGDVADQIDIDIYYGGGWHDLYEGSDIVGGGWNQYDIPGLLVTVTGVESGKHTIIVSADGFYFMMQVD